MEAFNHGILDGTVGTGELDVSIDRLVQNFVAHRMLETGFLNQDCLSLREVEVGSIDRDVGVDHSEDGVLGDRDVDRHVYADLEKFGIRH